jgi:hypothetical protein
MMPAKIAMATILVITLPLPHCLFQGSSGFLMGSGSGYVTLASRQEFGGLLSQRLKGLTQLPSTNKKMAPAARTGAS